ncbi:substrate-binding domain-containing protein [Microbacterium sp. SYP-A9085]|uniref:LacI family DNA-binding transcriptional regulator n=1 Tax=Microbacterium sp. SYP-A9085 TaxID=2664454 RepID=UPI00129BC2C5|nr:LacI family DNA-binding transcriptional regulator [Microbacterium sp. SYP-A9085]MRH29891.1 substrate-binding domain-containing protein [Microbacterium sp. SYP-A9085]
MPGRVTIADVATRAGVHKATVSRALNARTQHQVNTATVKRVQRAARELGYVPNVIARGLRTSLSMTIGVILPDLTNPLFPPIVRGIESHLSGRSYTALVVNTDGKDDAELAAFDSLLERRVDGLIVATGKVEHPLLADAYARGIPVVMLNRGTARGEYPLVVGDDAKGVTDAVEHLVRLGHRDLVHLAGPADFTTSLARSEAFTAAARRHPGLKHSIILASAFSIAAGEATMAELLARPEELPTAVVAGNDLIAVGVLRALRAHGLATPGDVSVVGFNDMPFAEDLNPPLTTVHIPHHEMGVQAARLLLEGIESGAQHGITITLPAELVVRSSTAQPREHSIRGPLTHDSTPSSS